MKQKNKPSIFKYYFKGTQIALTILIATFLGYQIDIVLNNNTQVVTIITSALAIFYSLYSLIKEVNGNK